jgi:precorrin-6B methylase 1
MAKLNRKKTPQDVKKNLTDETRSKFRVIIGEKLVTFAEKLARKFTIRDLRG